MFLALVVSLVVEVTGGSGAGPPDIKDFKPVAARELEFRIDDYKTAFIGQVVDYQNADDPNVFVRVYYRQVAIVSERARENNTAQAGGAIRNFSNLNYHRKRETEVLGRVQKAVDAFAYVWWRTIRDLRTGQDIRTGPMHIWLLDSGGTWVSHTQPAGTKSALDSFLFSEPSKADPKKRIIVGIQFNLVDGVHIVRIDQDDVLVAVKEKKQKEVGNEK